MTGKEIEVLAAFQSTPSAWRETTAYEHARDAYDISIHSLRMEGDIEEVRKQHRRARISIHSLRMEGDTCSISF